MSTKVGAGVMERNVVAQRRRDCLLHGIPSPASRPPMPVPMIAAPSLHHGAHVGEIHVQMPVHE